MTGQSLKAEEWRDTPCGRHSVSNRGRVYTHPKFARIGGGRYRVVRGKIREPWYTQKGYAVVNLDGRHQRLHRLVASLFVGNPHKYDQVNHIDGDKLNNYAANLEWVTNAQNMEHARRSGLFSDYTPVKNLDTGEIYPGMQIAARAIGVSASVIHGAINGKNKTCSGCRWAYA